MPGIRILLRAIAEGHSNAPEQIQARWTWKLARASRKVQDRRASAEYPEAKRLLGALANSRGHRHEENAARLVAEALKLPLPVGVALLASAEAYTPRASKLLDAAREEIAPLPEIAAALAENLPAPKAAPGRSRRRRRKKKGPQHQQGEGGSRPGGRQRSAPRARGRRAPRAAQAAPPQAESPHRSDVGHTAGDRAAARRSRAIGGATLADAMLVLLGIGFLAGIITALSPCVLPVLPILLAGGATGGRRRPYAIVAGIVTSFTVFTLVAAWLLDLLGLPEDVLRNLAIALLFVLAATLIFPRLGLLLERPLARLTRRRGGDLGGGFLLGASLGLVFVPCAGPVLATISVLAAQHKVGFEAVLLTFVYALGSGPADAARRDRRPARGRSPARPRPGAAPRDGRRSRRRRVRARVQHRAEPPGRARRLHRQAPALHRVDQLGAGTAREAAQRASPSQGRDHRLRARTGVHEDRALAQHAGRPAAHDRGPAGQGRASRLLDVLVHQLHPHPAAPARLVRGLPSARARDRRRPHARVRLRARARQRARRRRTTST